MALRRKEYGNAREERSWSRREEDETHGAFSQERCQFDLPEALHRSWQLHTISDLLEEPAEVK